MEEFAETDCAQCGDLTLEINLDSCLICNRFERACGGCMEKHRATHSEGEFEAFKREMLEEPPLTPREKLNLDLKNTVRKQADILCRLIDDQEWLVKRYENQCRVLAEELDRQRPAS